LVGQALQPCSSSSRCASRGPGGPNGGGISDWRRLTRAPEAEDRALIRPGLLARECRAAQSRQARPGRGGAGAESGMPRALLGHAARADELAQLGASQHHLALGVIGVRGGDAVGADALAGRVVRVRRQQALQPQAIEAAALGIQATALCGFSEASRPCASTAYGHRPWCMRLQVQPRVVAGQATPAPRPRRA